MTSLCQQKCDGGINPHSLNLRNNRKSHQMPLKLVQPVKENQVGPGNLLLRDIISISFNEKNLPLI